MKWPLQSGKTAIWLAGIIVIGLAVITGAPNTATGCLIRQKTGIHCPGCGGNRAMRLLADGHWLEAAKSNLLIYPVLFVVLALLCHFILRACKIPPRWNILNISRRQSLILLTIVILFTIWRNLPYGACLRPD